jgi:hypothetical protein
MKCDSRLVLVRTFANPCFGRKPKIKVATQKVHHGREQKLFDDVQPNAWASNCVIFVHGLMGQTLGRGVFLCFKFGTFPLAQPTMLLEKNQKEISRPWGWC